MVAKRAYRSGGAALAVLMSLSMPALAQSVAPPPLPQPVIILVDSQLITQQCLAGQAIRTQHDQYRQSYQSEFEAARRTLKQTEDDLVREKAVLSHEAWQAKAREFEQRVIDFNQRIQRSNLAVEKSYGVAMAELWHDFNQVAAEIADEMGANLVLPVQQAIYQDPRLDQTKAVIERMNKKFPVIVVPPPTVDGDPAPKAVKK